MVLVQLDVHLSGILTSAAGILLGAELHSSTYRGPAALMRGTQKRTRQQIQDEFNALKARVNIGGNATIAIATIETVRDNLPAVLRLVAEVLREPAFPESEFEQIRKLLLTSVDNAKSEPQVLASIELSRTLRPHPRGDVRESTTPEEEIEEVQKATLEDARKFYRATHRSVSEDRARQPHHRDARQAERGVRRRAAAEPQRHGRGLPGAGLANYMLGGGFLNSRLATRVRQKEGLSYGISSNLSAGSKEKDGSFMVNAIAAPQNVARVEAAVKEELEKAVSGGFTADEVAAARSGWLQSRTVGRSADGPLAATLAARDFDEQTMAWDADLEKKVGALTPAQIQDALRRHVAASAMSIVKAGDFKKVAQ